jgi:hypothetical protein
VLNSASNSSASNANHATNTAANNSNMTKPTPK